MYLYKENIKKTSNKFNINITIFRLISDVNLNRVPNERIVFVVVECFCRV